MRESENPAPPAPARAPFLLLAGIAALLLPQLLGTVLAAHRLRHLPPAWERGELDTSLIHVGLVQAPHLADTLRWWTGPWVAVDVPFYRPLASLLFWSEWRLFGDREWLYSFPAAAAHGAATLLFALLAYRLAARYRTGAPAVAAAAALFAGWAGAGGYRRTIVGAVTDLRKNQPDSLAAGCCFAALLCYLGAQDGSRRALAAAVAWYLAG